MIFDRRVELKPYEYPELLKYVDAMRHSYWLHSEFNYTSDIQDFHNMSDKERKVFTRTMLAISQIEVAVKTFWSDIHHTLPKPEIASVWVTFWDSEVRHQDLYSHILEILWLDNMFTDILDVECMKGRIEYLQDSLKNKNVSIKEFVKSLILFSLFIENVSLFSQFYIAMSFNKFKGYMKGMSNGIEASTKEENLHQAFWTELVNIIKEEYPELITTEDEDDIINMCNKAYKQECKIIDWIFEDWDLDFVGKNVCKEYIKKRTYDGLKSIWIDIDTILDNTVLQETNWFNEEISITKHTDFFNKRSINYTKKDKDFSSNNLF